jgi:hypothetical protein
MSDVIGALEQHAQGIAGLEIYEVYNTYAKGMCVSVVLWSDDEDKRNETSLSFFFDEHERLKRYGVSGSVGPLDFMKVVEKGRAKYNLYKKQPDTKNPS